MKTADKTTTVADAKPGQRIEIVSRHIMGAWLGTGHEYTVMGHQDCPGKVKAWGIGGQTFRLHPGNRCRVVTA